MNTGIDIKVTRIENRYHSRLMKDGQVLREMACAEKYDIGWISREMLRWYDKLGGVSRFASAARERQNSQPIGKVWYSEEVKVKNNLRQ